LAPLLFPTDLGGLLTLQKVRTSVLSVILTTLSNIYMAEAFCSCSFWTVWWNTDFFFLLLDLPQKLS